MAQPDQEEDAEHAVAAARSRITRRIAAVAPRSSGPDNRQPD
jgi:hypothetical protein